MEGCVICVRAVWSVMKESGEDLYSVGDVSVVGSVFGEDDMLVCAVVV